MASTTPVRRSGRDRKPNTRYANDVTGSDRLARLLKDGSGSPPPIPESQEAYRADPDTEFNPAATRLNDEAHDGGDSEGSVDWEDGFEVATPPDDFDTAVSILGPPTTTSQTPPRRHQESRRQRIPGREHEPSTLHSRGLGNPDLHKHSKRSHRVWGPVLGSAPEELLPIVFSRDRWAGSLDVTFPSRQTLAAVLREGAVGKSVTFGADKAELGSEADGAWTWYHEDSGERFRKRQKVEEIIDDGEKVRFMPLCRLGRAPHRILLGPWKRQKLFELGVLDAMDFGAAWCRGQPGNTDPSRRERSDTAVEVDEAASRHLGQNRNHVDVVVTDTNRFLPIGPEQVTSHPRPLQEDLQDTTEQTPMSFDADADATKNPTDDGRHKSPLNLDTLHPDRHEHKIREGWLLNPGGRVQCMAWAPNRHGKTQYLAVVVPASKEQMEMVPEATERGAPAFKPSASYPTCIQLWAIEPLQADDGPRRLDMRSKPKLSLLICTQWGNIRRLSWCPIPRNSIAEHDVGNTEPIGLLAGIWTDGNVRVVDVWIDKPGTSDLKYVKIKEAAFTTTLPTTNNSVHTSIAWLSSTDLATARADGTVSIHTIIPPPADAVQSIKPYFRHSLHATYIINLCPAYPYTPHFIASAGMEGTLCLTDLRNPAADSVTAPRQRLVSTNLVYSPHIRSFMAETENHLVHALPLRRFFKAITVARASSAVTGVAASRWHPHTLIGTAGGEVMCTNPLRRVIGGEGEDVYQQLWFQHEWVRGSQAQSSDGIASGEARSGSGISRFLEGFVAEIPVLRGLPSEGFVTETIFEEETGVTCLEWNPNIECAGWAAAGFGCGLIRVEDLAIE